MYAIPLAHVGLAKTERTTDLERFVRWEYGPADRAQVILSARGGFLLFPRRMPKEPPKRRFVKLRGLMASLRGRTIPDSVDG